MFSKVAILIATTFAVMASASPVAERDIKNSCNTGGIYCCNSVQEADAGFKNALGGLFGISTNAITGQVATNCSPLSILGGGGNSCSQQPVCCDHNNFNGLINLGCSPININF